MKKIHCEGCGMTEPLDLKKELRKIKSTVLRVGVRDQEVRWATEKTEEEKYEADLCPNCRGLLLHNYFGIDAQGSLDLPAFIEPRTARIARDMVGWVDGVDRER